MKKIFIVILFILLFGVSLVSCDIKSTALRDYSCTVEQLEQVKKEVNVCHVETTDGWSSTSRGKCFKQAKLSICSPIKSNKKRKR